MIAASIIKFTTIKKIWKLKSIHSTLFLSAEKMAEKLIQN
jgi:hypothetical protein